MNFTLEITAARASECGLTNWIGTFGRGRYSFDAKPVKTVRQAQAWIRRVAKDYPNSMWAIFPVLDYKGASLGFGTCEIDKRDRELIERNRNSTV